MSNIKLFEGLEIPRDLEDLLSPLLPYLIGYEMEVSPSTVMRIRFEFYFPVNTIHYDVERIRSFFYDVNIHIEYSEPIYSWIDPFTPLIPARRLGEKVICNLKIYDYTRTKKPTRTTERSEGSTPDSSDFSKNFPNLPPQRFA